MVAAAQEEAQILAQQHVLRTSETCCGAAVEASGVRVGAAVVLEVPGLAELAGAEVALEGPNPRVDLDMPVAVTVARKRLAAHAAAEGPVLEVLRLVQAVLKAVAAGEVAVAAGVAAVPQPGGRRGLAVTTVGPQLVGRHQGLPAPRAAQPLALATAAATAAHWEGGSGEGKPRHSRQGTCMYTFLFSQTRDA